MFHLCPAGPGRLQRSDDGSGLVRPEIFIFPTTIRGDGLPPDDSSSYKWDCPQRADGFNLIPEDFNFSVTQLDFETWRLTPESCPFTPLFRYSGGWPFTATITMSIPEAWAWQTGGPLGSTLYTLVKLTDAMTLTRNVSGFFRGNYVETSGAYGNFMSDCEAFIVNYTTQTCSGDGCTRRFVYSPDQSEFYYDVYTHFDPTAPTLRIEGGTYPVFRDGVRIYDTRLVAMPALFARIGEFSEGPCLGGTIGIGGGLSTSRAAG